MKERPQEPAEADQWQIGTKIDNNTSPEMTVKELFERMSHFGSKISIKLTGMENYTVWENAIRRKVRGLEAEEALEGREQDIREKAFFSTNIKSAFKATGLELWNP
jgi:hypothetical protein